MSPKCPNGLYEIRPSGTSPSALLLLSIIPSTPHPTLVLAPRGTAHAAQLWDARTDDAGRTTLRSTAHGTYVSYPAASAGLMLVPAAAPREWAAEAQPRRGGEDKTECDYVLWVPPDRASDTHGGAPRAAQALFAGVVDLEGLPPMAQLQDANFGPTQVWTFCGV